MNTPIWHIHFTAAMCKEIARDIESLRPADALTLRMASAICEQEALLRHAQVFVETKCKINLNQCL